MKNHHSKKKRKKKYVRFVIKLYVRGKNVNNLMHDFFMSKKFGIFIIVGLLMSVKSKVLL